MKKLFSLLEGVGRSQLGVWYTDKSLSDRRVIIAVSALCLASIIYLGMWEPLSDYRDAQATRYMKAQSLNDWMLLNKEKLRSAGVSNSTSAGRKSLLPMITASAKQFSLQLSRLQPEQDGSVSISIERQPFEKAIKWILALETGDQLMIDRISVDRTANAGLVNIQLRIK